MIVEERDYKVRSDKLQAFLKVYMEDGFPIQKEYLGTFLGHFTTESGELNHVVGMWGYLSLDDRAARRAKMVADPRWQGYLDKGLPLLETMTTRFLTPTAISPIK